MPGVAEGYAQILSCLFLFWYSCFFLAQCGNHKKNQTNLHPPPPAPILTVFSPPIMPGVAEGYAQIFLAFFLFWNSGFTSMRQSQKIEKKSTPPPPQAPILTVFFYRQL